MEESGNLFGLRGIQCCSGSGVLLAGEGAQGKKGDEVMMSCRTHVVEGQNKRSDEPITCEQCIERCIAMKIETLKCTSS